MPSHPSLPSWASPSGLPPAILSSFASRSAISALSRLSSSTVRSSWTTRRVNSAWSRCCPTATRVTASVNSSNCLMSSPVRTSRVRRTPQRVESSWSDNPTCSADRVSASLACFADSSAISPGIWIPRRAACRPRPSTPSANDLSPPGG